MRHTKTHSYGFLSRKLWWKKNPGKRDGPAGRKSEAQRKTGLVGERQLQPYAPHGVKRTNFAKIIRYGLNLNYMSIHS